MSSPSYVLVEYTNQTRKIQGEWSRKSYKALMKEIRSKFAIDFDQALEIKVYDKNNDKYFFIDKNEMNFIPRGGLIRVVKSKTTSRQSPRKPPPKSPSKASTKPPGVPPHSKQDDQRRNQWRINSRVEVYSEEPRKWQKGQIEDIFNDAEGEWLVIRYAGFRTKEIQRFSNYIRPIAPTPTAKAAAKSAPKSPPKASKKSPTKPKAKKAEKITTQSKYRKKESSEVKEKENEIHISGNAQHLKQYIDRACVLLRGYDSMQRAVDEDEKGGPTYNVIELVGRGRAMGAVVSTAEIVKRIVAKLHQVTILESAEVSECWTPLEQGLVEVETRRSVAQLRVILAVDDGDIDREQCGYQEPIARGDFAANLSYRYEGKARGGGGGKGKRGRG